MTTSKSGVEIVIGDFFSNRNILRKSLITKVTNNKLAKM